MFKRFIVGIMLLFSVWVSHAEDESVLWWMFDEDTLINEINGSGSCKIYDLVGRGDATGKTVNGIRIGAYSGDELLGYLVMADDNGSGNDTVFGMPALDFDTWEESWNAGPTYAHISGYDTTPGIMFMIELGMLEGKDTWSILASSDPATIEQLRQFMDVANFDMHTTFEWTGGSYSVPEPNSGILFLIGGCLLVLRRKRK